MLDVFIYADSHSAIVAIYFKIVQIELGFWLKPCFAQKHRVDFIVVNKVLEFVYCSDCGDALGIPFHDS